MNKSAHTRTRRSRTWSCEVCAAQCSGPRGRGECDSCAAQSDALFDLGTRAAQGITTRASEATH